MKKWALLFLACVPSFSFAAVSRDGDGWTVVTPSGDSRIIYVSNSDGNDADNGLTEATAKRTIEAGIAIMRDGYPDHLLLKRGDTFVPVSNYSIYPGRSAAEPSLLGGYGTGARPVIRPASGYAGISINEKSNIAIIGVKFDGSSRGSNPAGTGIAVGGDSDNILIEDNHISQFTINIAMGGSDQDIDDVTIRRNIIIDAWSTTDHAQGIYSASVDGLVIEENFFDHNGWNEAAGAEPNIYNHNMYLSHGNLDMTIRGNVISRGSNMGVKFQPLHGTHAIDNNLFIRNSFALGTGGVPQAHPPITGIELNVRNNVIVEAESWVPSQGYGVALGNTSGGTFANNILANKRANTTGGSFGFADGIGWETEGHGIRNFTVENNTFYNWRGSIRVQQPTSGNPLPVIQNTRFINNILQEPDASYTGPLMHLYTADSNVNSFTGGAYYRAASATNNVMLIGAANQSLATWEVNTGETSASPQTQISFSAPTRGGDSFAVTAGYANWLNLVTAVTSNANPRSLGNVNFQAETINTYIRAGFQTGPVAGSVTRDANGWTVVTPASDSRIIYVSNSDGNDADNGLTQATAKRTIAAGAALLRNGFPDHLLLRRGDTWRISTTLSISANGRSATEPILLGTYGTGARPRIDSGDVTCLSLGGRDYVSVIGWHIEPTNRTVGSTRNGINAFASPTAGNRGNILIEDCYVAGHRHNIEGTAENTGVPLLRQFTVRRNVVVDAWAVGAHAQGLFTDFVDGLLVEENVFDHNGWNESIPGAEATMFNHNMYISWENRNVTVRNNVSSRGSSMGLKIQPEDGPVTIQNNLFVRNGLVSQVGASGHGGAAGAVVNIENNVAIEGNDNGALNSPGLGWTLQNVESGFFRNNITANRRGTGNVPNVLQIVDSDVAGSYGVHNLTLEANVFYDWRGPVYLYDADTYEHSGIVFRNNQFQEPVANDRKLVDLAKASVVQLSGNSYFDADPVSRWFGVGGANTSFAQWQAIEPTAVQTQVSYLDASRTATKYAQVVLGVNSFEDMMAAMRQQSRSNWQAALSAAAVNDYIREGFNKAKLGNTPPPYVPPVNPPNNPPALPPSTENPATFKNVFNPSKGEELQIPCEVNIKVLTRRGDLVKNLSCDGGTAVWSGKNASSGIYILQESGVSNRKVAIVK